LSISALWSAASASGVCCSRTLGSAQKQYAPGSPGRLLRARQLSARGRGPRRRHRHHGDGVRTSRGRLRSPRNRGAHQSRACTSQARRRRQPASSRGCCRSESSPRR